MNYYYDLVLNFSNQKPYKFYEWKLDDHLLEIKKIPIYKISESNLKSLVSYEGLVEKSFLDKIKNRTIYKVDGKIKAILYCALFTDTKFSIAVLFDENGYIVKRSYLLLEDELNIIEIGFSLKKEKLVFHKEKKLIFNNYLRQEEDMKKIIKKELEKSYQEKNNSKLIYYYLEWFNKYNSNVEEIYLTMINELDKKEIKDIDKIYNLVLLSIG